MIQTSTFNIIITLGFAMLLYSTIDHRNRIYSNIVFAFLSGITFAFLSNASKLGVVASGTSASLGDLLNLISTFAFAYVLFMGYEIVDEEFQKKEMEAKQTAEVGE